MRVVYITGSGRSGSTILDMMLGAHSRAFSLGQVDELDRWVRTRNHCTCGRPVDECPLWGALVSASSPPPPSLNVDGQVRKVASIVPAIARPERAPATAAEVEAAWDLYEQVAAATGAEVLVDSSKSLLRFAGLAAAPRGHDLRLIHLLRDPRGFVLSRTRSKPVPTAAGGVGSTTRQSYASALGDWVVQNALVAAYASRRRPPQAVVTYEQLVSHPEQTLGRLCELAGLELEPRQLPPLQGEFHLIGGNASRLQFERLRLDESWRTELPRWQRATTLTAAGWLDAMLRRRAERRPAPASSGGAGGHT